jgi:hypothetical protein
MTALIVIVGLLLAAASIGTVVCLVYWLVHIITGLAHMKT